MPQTFSKEMLKFLPAMPEAHAGCTMLVSTTCLNKGYLKNNKKSSVYIYIYIYIYKLTFKNAMASDITATDFGFGASAPKMLAINSLTA